MQSSLEQGGRPGGGRILTGVLISPIWASAAMTLSSVSVIGNALRLRQVAL